MVARSQWPPKIDVTNLRGRSVAEAASLRPAPGRGADFIATPVVSTDHRRVVQELVAMFGPYARRGCHEVVGGLLARLGLLQASGKFGQRCRAPTPGALGRTFNVLPSDHAGTLSRRGVSGSGSDKASESPQLS